MNKKRVLGLLLFSCLVIAGMYLGTMLMIGQQPNPYYNQNQQEISNEATYENSELAEDPSEDDGDTQKGSLDTSEDEWYYSDATDVNTQDENDESVDNEDIDYSDVDDEENDTTTTTESEDHASNSEEVNLSDNEEASGSNEDISANDEEISSGNGDGEGHNSTVDTTEPNEEDTDTIGESVIDLPDMQLIRDSNQVDYMKYIPEMVYDSRIEGVLDITNPILDVKAKSAILFDANTGEVLYYKDPVIPIFPASTSKLLTALVALDWCMEEEEVIAGNELDLVASDSSRAGLKKGQVLTIRNLLEGMLVPSGNDAAYVVAAYVGRKSLQVENASLKEAIPEFIRLMNSKAESLGAINSCFKTPDGYDAIGQYTTAYDMGMVGMAAADNDIILDISKKSSARNIFVDGRDVTWSNTNSLINKNSGRYYQYCLGLKTGTSTMAGRCLISVAKKDGREVISVVMNSDAVGRWEDSIKLLKYGLGN